MEEDPKKAFALASLNEADLSKFTVRINTWKRPEQLQVSIEHFLTCDRVAQIQVVWCIAQGPPPEWLTAWISDRLVVETHTQNSLNSRFDVLVVPPTKGILTVDDDVLRPCLAVDVAFAKWASHPDRMVGFDARTHVIEKNNSGNSTTIWKYGYLSETTRTNRYSITLSRFAFVHVDYLRSYIDMIPREFLDHVTENMNCEDILLSFWISHLTSCQAPLLADFWAMKSQVKLYSPQTISGNSEHKAVRDECVNLFRLGFELDCLERATWIHHDDTTNHLDVWDAGLPAPTLFSAPQSSIEKRIAHWKHAGLQEMGKDVGNLIQDTLSRPFSRGLIEGTAPWKERFHKDTT